MKRLRIFLAIFLLSLIIIFVSLILLLRRIGISSLPQQDGAIALQNVSRDVQILRDTLGVPYVLAESDSDAYFALGFVHAQDRLFQMEMYRRLGEGRLSEVFGKKTLSIDMLFRTLRFLEMADSIYASVSPLSKDILRWYSNGVNSYLSTARTWPAEFPLLQFEPAKWRPQDCIVVARLMAWELNTSWWTKPVFGEIFDRFGADTASLLIPQLISPEQPQRHSSGKYTASLDRLMELNSEALRLIGGSPVPDGIGSNNWAIAPKKTNTGTALLCNDPHLAFSEPTKWYIVSISSPGLHAIGVTLPGTPGIVIGRNQDISWGMTNIMADDGDFYLIHPDSTDPSLYLYDGQLIPFQSVSDTIRVKDDTSVVFTKRMTVQGPVVSDVISSSYKQTSLGTDADHASGIIALRWNAYFPSDETRSIYLLNTAKNYQDFLNALKFFGVPAQNFIYSDTRGNIGFKAAGNIPLRNYTLPILPQEGNSSKVVWRSFIPFELLPGSYNPVTGFVATANNKTTPETFPYYVTNLYEPSSRIERIVSFIEGHNSLNVDLCEELQLDYHSDLMSLLNNKLLAACDSEHYYPKEIIYLRNFDGNLDAKSTAATILNETYVEIMRRLFEPVLGSSLFEKYVLISSVPTRILQTMLNNAAVAGRLYGIANGDSLMDFDLAQSLETTLQSLRETYGQQPINWMWGRIHTLELNHPLSSNSLMKKLYNLGPFARGGNNTTVNNGEFSIDSPFKMLVGPSMRMVVDMGQEGVYFSLPGGECGQLLSPHYSDFLNDYLSGSMKYFPMKLQGGGIMHKLVLVAVP